MNGYTDYIVIDPQICSGKPVLRGTRIMVKNILGMMAGGYSIEKIRETYPELNTEAIQAALEYASVIIDEEQIVARG